MSLRTYALPAAEVVPRRLEMIWRGRIPRGALSVIAGRPGLGKSTLATAIAAELSFEGKSTLISDLEDDMGAVTRPRLDVAGADLDFVGLIPADRAPVLPREMDQLGQLLRDTRADALILDPVGAHFWPETRVHDRPTLRILAQLARETDTAIVAMHHTTKSGTGDALDRLGGPSGGLAGTARAVYIFGYDPEDEDRRALACAKINGVDKPPTLIVEHETVDYDAGGVLLEAGQLRFVDETVAEARRVLTRGRSNRGRDKECVEWLTKYLAAGDDLARPVRTLRRESANNRFGWQTLLRAGTLLRVQKFPIGATNGNGGTAYWVWRLPDDHPLRKTADEGRGDDGQLAPEAEAT